MKVEFRNSFIRDLRRVRDKSVKDRVNAEIQRIEEVDDLKKVSNVRKLSGSGNYYRVRIGEYRLGVLLNQDTAIFVRCLPRRDINRYFP